MSKSNEKETEQCVISVVSGSSYAIWKDDKYGYCYGSIEQAKGKDIVEYCKDFEEAKLKWKCHYYR